MIRVLLNVPSPALRAGVSSLLSEDPLIRVIDPATDRTIDVEPAGEIDVIITTSTSPVLDLDWVPDTPSGSAILVLTDEPIDVRRLMKAPGAWGVLPLDTSAREICAAVNALAAGLIVGSGPLLSAAAGVSQARGPLTEREVQVLGLVSRGLANKQIALELGISEHTVKFHISSIYTKLDVTNRTQAVREGLRNGWIVL